MRAVLTGFTARQLIANLALSRQERHRGSRNLKGAGMTVFFGDGDVQRSLYGLVDILDDERARWDFGLIDNSVCLADGHGGIRLSNTRNLWRVAAQRLGKHTLVADK